MIRVLTFTPDDTGKYALLQIAIEAGSAALRQKKPDDFTRDVRRSEMRIQRSLRAIGHVPPDVEELKANAIGLTIDNRKRVLNGGGDVRLEQPDFKRLNDYVDATPWLQDLSEQITELQDWLEACPQVKDE